MKRKILLIALSLLMLTTGLLPLYAAESHEDSNTAYRWSYTREVNLNIYFNDTTGTVKGRVIGNSSATRIAGSVTLYYINFWGNWVETGDAWAYDVESTDLFINETFTAAKFRQYKAVLSMDVYSGNYSESVSTEALGTCS